MSEEKKFTNFQYTVIGFLALMNLILLGYIFLKKDRPVVINESDPSVKKGGISPYIKHEVGNTVAKKNKTIQVCYKKYLETKPQKLEGKIKLDWQVEPDGDTEKVEIVFSEFENKDMENCIIKELSTWKFPPPPDSDRNTYVSYTFQFKKTE